MSLQAGCCHSSQRQLYSVQAAKALESTQQRKDDLLLSKIVKTACNMLSRTRGSQNVEVPDEESAPRSTCPKLPNLATGFYGSAGQPSHFQAQQRRLQQGLRGARELGPVLLSRPLQAKEFGGKDCRVMQSPKSYGSEEIIVCHSPAAIPRQTREDAATDSVSLFQPEPIPKCKVQSPSMSTAR